MATKKRQRNNSNQKRQALDVINNAIRENRVAEILLYIFASIVVLTGTAVLIYGVVSDNSVTAIAGAISSSLFVPAMIYAKRIRK